MGKQAISGCWSVIANGPALCRTVHSRTDRTWFTKPHLAHVWAQICVICAWWALMTYNVISTPLHHAHVAQLLWNKIKNKNYRCVGGAAHRVWNAPPYHPWNCRPAHLIALQSFSAFPRSSPTRIPDGPTEVPPPVQEPREEHASFDHGGHCSPVSVEAMDDLLVHNG